MSRTASAKLAKIFDLGIGLPVRRPRESGGPGAIAPPHALDSRLRGNDGSILPQLLALAVACQEDVRLQEYRQHQRAARRLGDVTVAFRAPDVIPRCHLALVVDEAALEHKGLLD